MKLYRLKTIAFFFLLATMGMQLFAQEGYSSASLSMGKMRADELALPYPSEVIVEEYMNYHRHAIRLPEGNEKIALDVQTEFANVQNGEEVWVQIGIASKHYASREDLPPINITLVVDKSGSMSGDRIQHARDAMKTLVEMLRPADIVSIVAFDHQTEVVWPAAPLSDPSAVLLAIDRIQPGGSTNLNLGMVTGYRELLKHYSSDQTNQIIMLTDAITNTGVIDPMQIIRNSSYYQSEARLGMTLIGVGTQFNNTLSRQLTSSSGSSIHFIHDSKDIEKVFVEEMESLVAPIGNQAKMTMQAGRGLELIEIMGYEPTLTTDGFELDLNNINAGLTQVILAKVRVLDNKEAKISLTLNYTDVASGNYNTLTTSSNQLISSTRKRSQATPNSSVQKNRVIGEMALTLKSLKNVWEEGNEEQALALIQEKLTEVRAIYPQEQDEDIDRVAQILQQYLSRMEKVAQVD